MPALRIAAIVSTTTGRTPVWPGGERLQPQEHQRADHLALDPRAHAGGVRTDQAALQLGAQLGADVADGERAEAGGDAVDRLGLGGERVDHGAGLGDGLRSPPARISTRASPRATASTSSAATPWVPTTTFCISIFTHPKH